MTEPKAGDDAVDEILATLEELRRLGVRPRGYDLESPHTRRLVHSSHEEEGDVAARRGAQVPTTR